VQLDREPDAPWLRGRAAVLARPALARIRAVDLERALRGRKCRQQPQFMERGGCEGVIRKVGALPALEQQRTEQEGAHAVIEQRGAPATA
jgi:hypothetical protein